MRSVSFFRRLAVRDLDIIFRDQIYLLFWHSKLTGLTTNGEVRVRIRSIEIVFFFLSLSFFFFSPSDFLHFFIFLRKDAATVKRSGNREQFASLGVRITDSMFDSESLTRSVH